MTNLKTSKRYLSALSLAVILTSPAIALAENEGANTRWTQRAEEAKAKMEERKADREEKQEERKDNRQEAFCSRFTETIERINGRLEDRGANVKDRVENRGEKRSDRRDGRDEWLGEKRGTQDERRSALYTKLDERADTDAEKAAVAEFKSTIDAAVVVRRSAVDKAISDFRSAVDSLVGSKKDGVSSAYTEFKSAADAAIAKAKSDCAGDVDPSTVRSTFNAAMKAAREGLKDDRSTIDKVRDDIQTLAETRKKSVEAALATFKTAVETAKEKLQGVMGKE
jgi:hypothetical protein